MVKLLSQTEIVKDIYIWPSGDSCSSILKCTLYYHVGGNMTQKNKYEWRLLSPPIVFHSIIWDFRNKIIKCCLFGTGFAIPNAFPGKLFSSFDFWLTCILVTQSLVVGGSGLLLDDHRFKCLIPKNSSWKTVQVQPSCHYSNLLLQPSPHH